MFTRIASIVLLCALSAAASAQQTGSRAEEDSKQGHHKSISAKDFARKAAAAGMAEVKMGSMAVEKATNPEVKAFAQQMVSDHTKANDQLKTLASSKKLDLPDSANMMHKIMSEKFEHQKAGKEFDQDFMKQMVKDHKDAVELFENAANDSTLDPELKAFASKTLPTLRQHLKKAESLQAQLSS